MNLVINNIVLGVLIVRRHLKTTHMILLLLLPLDLLLILHQNTWLWQRHPSSKGRLLELHLLSLVILLLHSLARSLYHDLVSLHLQIRELGLHRFHLQLLLSLLLEMSIMEMFDSRSNSVQSYVGHCIFHSFSHRFTSSSICQRTRQTKRRNCYYSTHCHRTRNISRSRVMRCSSFLQTFLDNLPLLACVVNAGC